METINIRICDSVICNPSIKLEKGKECPVIDIDKITVGRKFVENKDTVIYNGQSGAKFENGDTLMARITPCLENGKMAQAKIVGKGIGSTELFVFRGKDGFTDNDYVYYLFKQQYIRDLAANSMSGASGRQRADLKFIKNIKINLPTLPIQRRIASILSAYDNLIENNNRRIRLLEQMVENLYKEWFVRFRFPGHEKVEMENGLPKGWKYEDLFSVATVSYGYAFKSELFCDNSSLNAVVRIRDIQDNHTDTYTSESCDEKYLIKKNAVLIGMDGIFHMCLWNGDKAYLNQRVVMLNSKYEHICNYYLFMAIHAQVKFWEQVIAGTTVAHLGDKHLRKMKVLIPNENILERANSFLESIMNERNKLFKQNQLLTRQRDLLLPRLMSGKLEVNA